MAIRRRSAVGSLFCHLLCGLFATLTSATALATKCPRPDPDLPPPTASEQAQLDAHALAKQRAELDLQSAIRVDPLLSPLVAPWELLSADRRDPASTRSALQPWLMRDELIALAVATNGFEFGGEEGGEMSPTELSALVSRWVSSAPLWSLVVARHQQQQGQPEAADQSLRAYLARARESGRLNRLARRVGFRFLGLVLRHEPPEHPLPGRDVGCGAAGMEMGLSMALPFLHDIETVAALTLGYDMLGDGVALCPDPDSDESVTPPRAALCAQLKASIRQQSSMIGALDLEEENDAGEDWWDSCFAQVREAANATDWRGALDRLAVAGCKVPDPENQQ